MFAPLKILNMFNYCANLVQNKVFGSKKRQFFAAFY
tara:strand:- start:14410 stop:14517 length:108 start_codon:yes stop_codon:yes gene_type:complete